MVPGSIPNGVTGDFFRGNPKEPCALMSTQPLKVNTRDFSWGKGFRCFWLTTYHPCSAETSRKSWALTYPQPLGPPRPVAGNLYLLYGSIQEDRLQQRTVRWNLVWSGIDRQVES